ncbi:MAG TPA: cbb3-type cytochrome c oxidase subunit II [Bryobacteraceae bacterium]|nr:cbb3-type cytochrome c oxidase subunit II [Bryobacteraceae bacterium]
MNPNQAPRVLRMSYIVASVAGVAFFVMSVLLLGVWPGRVLENQTSKMSPEHPLGLSASELRGREIYSHEGCAYCHTQQVRYLQSDMARFGAPTLAWETRFDYPHLWGTRRIGPDLARQSGTHPADWQFVHLYSPRAVVADSVMPAFSSLFEGSPERPKQAARDLVSYLETLGRDRELAGPEGEAHARAGCDCADDEMAQMAFHSAVLNANPRKTRRKGDAAPLLTGDDRRGLELYARNCASCHGMKGRGDGLGAAGLHPPPTNLAEHEYGRDRLSFALTNGIAGTAMPAWRDFSRADLSALAAAVRGFHEPQLEPNIPKNILDLGARVYAANCAQCHGPTGGGDGTAVSELDIVPANLGGGRPSLGESLRVLRNGIDGTQMAPWTSRLSEAELSAVAYYVRGFYREEERQ